MKLTLNVKRGLNKLLKDYPLVSDIAQKIQRHGGRTFLVGGAVRDILLEVPTKDLDIEVHGISLQELEAILKESGVVNVVGKAFGVLRLDNFDVDWSVPRTDASGRKPSVVLDPRMSIEQAFKRRDLTINAMGIDIITHALVDPFDGRADLKKGILRAPNGALFLEDPLRFFRVMQFVARFEMHPDAALNKLCSTMSIAGISRERIEGEFEKLLLKSSYPSLGLRWLDKIGRLDEVLSELAAVKGIKQNPRWHPEGDVFEHIMQAIDAAATREYATNFERCAVLYAALCHDIGKESTTKEIEGSIKSIGHEKESARLAKKMLKRITKNKDLIATVVKLVRYHMQPLQLVAGDAKPSAYKRLALKLAPETTLEVLGKLVLADKQARNPKKGNPLKKSLKEVDEFLKRAHAAKVLNQVEKPVLQGRDLMDVMKPGPEMGVLLKKAYALQLQEGIQDKEVLKKRILKKK